MNFSWRQQAQKNNCPHCLLHYCLPPHLCAPPPWQKAPTLSYGDGQEQSSLLNRFTLVLVDCFQKQLRHHSRTGIWPLVFK